MQIVNGFLFSIGFWIAPFLLLFGLFCIKRFTPQYADVELWADYAKMCKDQELYEECRFVEVIINNSKDKKKIKIPPKYTLEKEVFFKEYDGKFKIETIKRIVKISEN